MGRDWRPHDAVPLEVGPVLHLDDAVGSKSTVLLGRSLPRDFVDVAAALDRYSRRELLELALTRDRGLRAADAALAAQQLDRLHDGQFAPYQLTGDDITALRERFPSWPRDGATITRPKPRTRLSIRRPPAPPSDLTPKLTDAAQPTGSQRR